MDNYLEITSDQYHLLNTGDYIRWISDKKNEYTSGAMIETASMTKSNRGMWTLRFNNNKTYTLYWDLYTHVMVRKPLWINIMEKELLKIYMILGKITNSLPNKEKEDVLEYQKNIEIPKNQKYVYKSKNKKEPLTRSISAKMTKHN